MDFVTLPHGLFVFYGALVLGCGVVLGVVIGRNLRRRPASPPPDRLLQRRVDLLEEGLDLTDAAVERLVDDRERSRGLRSRRARPAAA